MKANVTRIKLYYLIKLWTQLNRHTHSTPVIPRCLLLSFWLKPEAAEMTHCSFNLLWDQSQIYWLYCGSVNCLTVCVCVLNCVGGSCCSHQESGRADGSIHRAFPQAGWDDPLLQRQHGGQRSVTVRLRLFPVWMCVETLQQLFYLSFNWTLYFLQVNCCPV